MLPDYTARRTENAVFQNLRDSAVSEAFDVQAASALDADPSKRWYPQFMATAVIAVDRDQTNAPIGTWRDLSAASEEIGYISAPRPHNELLLCAISYGLEGEGFSLRSAASLLRGIQDAGRLTLDSFDAPILICFDYQAAALIHSGRNLEIVIPSEGTLSYEKGLVSNNALIFASGSLTGAATRRFTPTPRVTQMPAP